MEINIDHEILNRILKNKDVAYELGKQKDDLELVNKVKKFIENKDTLSIDNIKSFVAEHETWNGGVYFMLQLFVSMATDISIEFCDALCDAFDDIDYIDYERENDIKLQCYISSYYKKSVNEIQNEIAELSEKKDFVLVKYLMFVYGQDVKDKSRYLFGHNSCDSKRIFFAKTLDLINNNQPKSDIVIPKDINFILEKLKPLMSEIDFDGCVHYNLNKYFNYIRYMTDILQKFNTNELMGIDLKTLSYQQQFILFKTLQRKDSRNYVQENDIRKSLTCHYRNSGWSCAWNLQQCENKELVSYLLKFITRDDVLPETKLLLAVYFNVNDRNREQYLDWNDEVQIVTENFADLNGLLDAILTVYSKIKDDKKLHSYVQEIIDNIIRCYGSKKMEKEIIRQDDTNKLSLLLQSFRRYTNYYGIIEKAEFACKILLNKKNLTENNRKFLLSDVANYVAQTKRYCIDYSHHFEWKRLDQIKSFVELDLLIVKNPRVSIEIKRKIYEEAKQAFDQDRRLWDAVLDMYIADPTAGDSCDPCGYDGTNLNKLKSDNAEILSDIKTLEEKVAALNKQYEYDKPKLNWIWFTVIGTIYYIGKLIYLATCFRINKNKIESDINKLKEKPSIVKFKQAEDKQKKWRSNFGDIGSEQSQVYKDHEKYCSWLSSIIDACEGLDVSSDKELTKVKSSLPEQTEQLKPKVLSTLNQLTNQKF